MLRCFFLSLKNKKTKTLQGKQNNKSLYWRFFFFFFHFQTKENESKWCTYFDLSNSKEIVTTLYNVATYNYDNTVYNITEILRSHVFR